MRNSLLLSIALTTGFGLCSNGSLAQEGQPQQVAAEHRYFFSCQGVTDDFTEKKLGEALRGLDPEMVVSIDRDALLMKLIAQYTLNTSEVVSLASQYGVVLVPRRVTGIRDGAYTFQD